MQYRWSVYLGGSQSTRRGSHFCTVGRAATSISGEDMSLGKKFQLERTPRKDHRLAAAHCPAKCWAGCPQHGRPSAVQWPLKLLSFLGPWISKVLNAFLSLEAWSLPSAWRSCQDLPLPGAGLVLILEPILPLPFLRQGPSLDHMLGNWLETRHCQSSHPMSLSFHPKSLSLFSLPLWWATCCLLKNSHSITLPFLGW